MALTDYLVVGLGNPGKKYAGTRHNAGFMAIDHFAEYASFPSWQVKFDGTYCRRKLSDRQVSLVKPATYMNRSGRCVAAFVRFFKVPQDHILILHDDLDLPLGRVKAVAGGGSGGHNGVRSIMRELGGSNFARLKIGIDRPPRDEQGNGIPVDRFVLAPFSPEEQDIISSLFLYLDKAVSLFVEEGIVSCMNQINSRNPKR